MATIAATAKEETRIRARLEDWAAALRARDADGVMAVCTPDIVAFDCHSHLQIRGAAAYRKFLEACFPCMQGALTFAFHELEISAEDEHAFCHFIARCVAIDLEGGEHASWLRSTLCLRKEQGEWRIAHGHLSAPFDPTNSQAMLDLAPEGARA